MPGHRRAVHAAMLAAMLAAVLVTGTVPLPSSPPPATAAPSCATPRPAGDVQSKALGPAVTGFPVNQAERVGDRLYVLSMDLEPARLVEYDIPSRRVVARHDLPTGTRSWALTSTRDALWIGLWNRPADEANLLRFDLATATFTSVARIPSRIEFWSLDAGLDGTLYAGTDVTGTIFAYDPADGSLRELSVPAPDGTHIGAVVARQGRVFAATRAGAAGVYEINPRTGHVRTVRSADGDVDGIYALGVRGDVLAAGTTGPAAQALLVRLSTGEEAARATVPDDTAAESLVLGPAGDAYFTTKPSGALYRLDVDGELVQLAHPVRDAPTRNLFLAADTLLGANAAETVWSYDVATGDLQRTNLLTAGADGAPVAAMSLAVADGKVVAGANNRLQVRDPVAGTVRHTVVPGEPKDVVATAGTTYVALYPYGSLSRFSPEDGSRVEVADWNDDFNRPRDATVADGNIEVAALSDARQTGAVITYEPGAGADTDTSLPAAASLGALGDGFVLGSEGPHATLIRVRGADHARVWETVAAKNAGDVTGIVAYDDDLHVLTADGTHVVLDVEDGQIVHRARLPIGTGGDLVANGGRVYAAGRDVLVAIDADDFTPTTLLDGLDAQLFERPRLAMDADCRMYLFRGHDVLRVEH